ncbi:MAG: class I SAM-dependent methyltransferase [Treponema sp.]|nr:class I SAM-dependent methyltransferase [Treponema sp.]
MSFTDNFGHPKGLIGRLMLIMMDREHRPVAEWGLSQFTIPESSAVIDIGCGGGYNIKRILTRIPNVKVVGLDISEESVKKAKSVNKGEIGKRCEIKCGSVEKIEMEDSSFDVATAFETVFFWPDPENNFKEVKRILKDSGSFVVINNYGNPDFDWEKKVPCMKRYAAEHIKNFMELAGFTDIKMFQKDTMYCVVGKKA